MKRRTVDLDEETDEGLEEETPQKGMRQTPTVTQPPPPDGAPATSPCPSPTSARFTLSLIFIFFRLPERRGEYPNLDVTPELGEGMERNITHGRKQQDHWKS